MTMTFSYHLDGAGWATATIANEGQHRDMTASYLSDSLLEMTQAAICLLEGADAVRFSFDDERESIAALSHASVTPTRKFVFFGLMGFGQVCQMSAVRKFSPAPAPQPVFVARCYLVCSVCLLSTDLKVTKKLWVLHDFPSEKFERLGTLVYEHRREKTSA